MKNKFKIIVMVIVTLLFFIMSPFSKVFAAPQLNIEGYISSPTVTTTVKMKAGTSTRMTFTFNLDGESYYITNISVNPEGIVSAGGTSERTTITALARGRATITVKYAGNSEGEIKIIIEVDDPEAEDPAEEKPSEETPSGETPEEPSTVDPIVGRYNAINFETYKDIYTNKKYLNMSEEQLKTLADIIKSHLKIVEEYLEKYDKIVKYPVRPADDAKEEEFTNYYKKLATREKGYQDAYSNKQLARNLLIKVYDSINNIRYGAKTPDDMDKSLWEKAKEFLNPDQETVSGSKVANATVTIGSILITAAAILFPVLTIIIGIKFMLANSEEKGTLKTQLVGLLVTSGITFGAYIIWRIAYALMGAIIK